MSTIPVDPATDAARGYVAVLTLFDGVLPWGTVLPAGTVMAVENVVQRRDGFGFPVGSPVYYVYALRPDGTFATCEVSRRELSAVSLADQRAGVLTEAHARAADDRFDPVRIETAAHRLADSMGWPREMIFAARFLNYSVSYPFWPGRAVR